MKWNRLHQIRRYARSSLWVVPLVMMPLALLTSRALRWIDPWLDWHIQDLSVAGAQAILQLIVTAALSFVVFTFGSLLVAIQVASAQLTPRIIATTLLRDGVVKYTVSLFIFTLLFALTTQSRIGANVPELAVFVASVLGVSCFAAFFYLIDYASRLLRPISILNHVAKSGLTVIRSVYPEETPGPERAEHSRRQLGTPDRVLGHQGGSGIVLAVNLKAVTAEAVKMKGVIEFVPQVGDFVAIAEPIFKLYGNAALADEKALRATVALGSERTMEQDPTFAFRIVIDIALRALSPAINDPTTAVLAIDQLHRMLRVVGERNLHADEVTSESGDPLVIFRTPNWEDFVSLAFSEIRQCGSSQLQIVRRLRSMIENLIDTLPAYRHPALKSEFDQIDRDVEKSFNSREDMALARVADSQGLGGRSSTPA
jgi:uncharacterized membrane protein